MDQQRDEFIIYEEQVHFLSERRVSFVQRNFSVVQKFVGCVKVVNHNSLIFCDVIRVVSSFVLPHLKNVDKLSKIASARACYQFF